MLNLSLLFDGPVDDRPELPRDRRQARQRADRGADVLCSASSPGWRRYKAVHNDDRACEQGLPPLEKLDDEKVLVWPDLVYTELICMVALTAVLIVWAIVLQAPLEEPASSVKTPNPSKAPWYFLGLQEMLVYFDPWMAGVVLPSLIIVGPDGDSVSSTSTSRATATTRSSSGKFAYIDVSVRLSGAVGDADRAGHVLARAELELSSGRSSTGIAHKVLGAEQRQPVGIFLGQVAWAERCRSAPMAAAWCTQLGYIVLARVAGHLCWCWATSSCCRR